MKSVYLILGILLFSVSLFGQSKEQEQKQKLLEKGRKLYKEYNYVKAAFVYKELEALGSKSATARIGDCYRNMNDMVNAEFYYAKTVKQKSVNSIYYFYYAQTLMSNEKYEAAMNWFQVYQRKEPKSDKADNLIKACKNVLKSSADKSNFEIINLDINSPAQDFAPCFYDKGIVFTSSRIGGLFRKRDMWTNTGYLDVYYSPLNWRDTIPGVNKVKGNVNTINYHDGPACINTTGDKIYFTRNNYVSGKATESRSGEIKLKIYSGTKSKDGFKNVKELNFNGNEYSCAHPSINHDESIIYFASDKGGGYGGTDIYYSTYNTHKKKWSRPINAGPAVNSAGNERFPFIHESGSLFYASDGKMGFGGLDIFEAIPNDSIPTQFDTIFNLGVPFNSSRDDFSYIIDENRITGYFASNREGGKGNDDIYMFTDACIPFDIYVEAGDSLNNHANVTIFDMDKAITLDENNTDKHNNFYSRLQLKSNYMIIIQKRGYKTIEYPLQTTNDKSPIELDFKMEAIIKDF